MKRLAFIRLFGCFLLFLAAGPVWGQGLLIVVDPVEPVPLPRPIIYHPRPRPIPPPISYRIKQLEIQSRIVDQVARVQVSQSFVNTGSRQMEVAFVFPLPYDGAIDQMTLMVDGKEYPARLLPAKEARSIYEGYIRRNQDPALLEWLGTGMFKTSVFPVPPGAERQVTLRFSQLLRKDGQLTDFLYPLSTAKYTSQPLEKLVVKATIESSSEIKTVYSPTHAINVTRPDEKHATISYQATNEVPGSDFRLFYDVAKGKLGASVISYRPDKQQDGYFVMLASPEVESASSERPAKTVIAVVDRSGSMSGQKMEQAKEALKFIVNNLRQGDLFNIVAYDSSVESFRPELERYNDENRKAALGFVEGLYAGGSTNIDAALSTSLAMIQDSSRPNFVVFLTDGLPTAGEMNESRLLAKITQANTHKARLISFGVGYDVNSRLLDRLSHQNRGQSEFVRPGEDIEVYVSRVYNRISLPVMTDVVVDIDIEGAKLEDGPVINRLYPREVHDLFAGEQLVLVGRYKKPGAARVTLRGKVGDTEHKSDFPAKFVKQSGDDSYAFAEKLWAMRRVGEIIDELDLHGQNQELVTELVNLSTKHGILTPYTSFLADENAAPGSLADASANEQRARQLLGRLAESGGISGFAQRDEKKILREAYTIPQSNFGGFGGRRVAGGAPSPGAETPLPAAVPAGTASEPADVQRAPRAFSYRDIDSDKLVEADAVQRIGKETLYRRGNLWIAANAKDVDLQKDAKKIKTIKRFTEEYFKLIAANKDTENAVLAQQQPGEELLIKLRGQLYRIE